ncbi:MAG TPA: single-stranded DNA-binding protein, partial [Elusimicrobiota bacterium]|nr:single-stranded DNA-binding protein [Elusimicrobiota bacterium]
MTSNLRLPALNDVRLVGRLTRDPELRFTTKGTGVCRFDIAVNRRFKAGNGEWQDETS